MAASNIIQKPLYPNMPVGQEIIFVIENNDAVQNQKQVKFGVNVHISNDTMPSVSVTTHLVGTFKTTPNNTGVGIFDFRNVMENYVSAEQMTNWYSFANIGSQYKGTWSTARQQFPIHLIDKWMRSPKSVAFMVLEFFVEYLGATDANNLSDPNVVRRADGTEVSSIEYTFYNSYVKYNDRKQTFNYDFGYSLLKFFPVSGLLPFIPTTKFLTNAPTTQFANIDDYGTVATLCPSEQVENFIDHMELTYYDCDDNQIGQEEVQNNTVNGGSSSYIPILTNKQMLFCAVYPGNLQNWSTTFQALVAAGTIQGGKITFRLFDHGSPKLASTKLYTIKLNCPEQKGYEPIRLCWLNQWGAWDYHTFTKKSTRTIKTKGTNYNQLSGTWNEGYYHQHSYKGGEKKFRVNGVERIKMNTDFLSEDFNVIFEELTNSPEVYMLEGYQNDQAFAMLNQYVKPVRLTTSSFTRKTIANDKLIQYTFEIEKSKTLRTQSI